MNETVIKKESVKLQDFQKFGSLDEKKFSKNADHNGPNLLL